MALGKAPHWTEDERQQESKHHRDKKSASVGQSPDEQNQEYTYNGPPRDRLWREPNARRRLLNIPR
jgi:hypothetical protein